MASRFQPAVAYLRTSSAANVGADKDSDKRQRAAIEAFAKRASFTIVGEYYDAAVSGADPVDQRPGFMEMLHKLAANGAKTIIVESPDRFARDLPVQLAGHDMLKGLGIAIIPASAPDFFTEDTPTAVLVRQVLGATGIASGSKQLFDTLPSHRGASRALHGQVGNPSVVTTQA